MKKPTRVLYGLTVEQLRQRLRENVLSPTFEAYGNFVGKTPDGKQWFAWGNFHDVSAVFSLETTDAALVEELTALVRANQATPAYQQAKAEIAASVAERIAEEAARLERGRRGLR